MCNRKGADDNGHMAEEPRAWKARTRGSETEVDGVIRPSTVTITPKGATRRFCAGWPICTIWCPTSVGLSMPGSVVWKSKEAKSRHATGCAISKFSRLEAFDERCRTSG